MSEQEPPVEPGTVESTTDQPVESPTEVVETATDSEQTATVSDVPEVVEKVSTPSRKPKPKAKDEPNAFDYMSDFFTDIYKIGQKAHTKVFTDSGEQQRYFQTRRVARYIGGSVTGLGIFGVMTYLGAKFGIDAAHQASGDNDVDSIAEWASVAVPVGTMGTIGAWLGFTVGVGITPGSEPLEKQYAKTKDKQEN